MVAKTSILKELETIMRRVEISSMCCMDGQILRKNSY